MSRVTLLARRSTAHRGLLALVWLLVAVLTGALGVTVGWTQVAATAGTRDGLTSAEPAERAVQLATRVADGADAEQQDARVRQALAGLLEGVPHRVTYDLRTEPRYTRGADGEDLGRWSLAVLPAGSRAEALAGAVPRASPWPTAPGPPPRTRRRCRPTPPRPPGSASATRCASAWTPTHRARPARS
nr:hypothetical protein GCM10025730_42340 [Promicromonospora thailandica]